MKEEYRPNIHMVDNALVRDYNKNVETQTVATTFELTWSCEEETFHKAVSRSAATDGSLLSVLELVPRLIQNPGNGNKPENVLGIE